MGDHLTQPDPELARLERATPNGMAYWAGTGPPDKTCTDCERFMGRFWEGELHAGRCSKYIKLMLAGGANKAPDFRIPPMTAACKYFEQRTTLRGNEMKEQQQQIRLAARDEALAAINASADRQSAEIAAAMRAIADTLAKRWKFKLPPTGAR